MDQWVGESLGSLGLLAVPPNPGICAEGSSERTFQSWRPRACLHKPRKPEVTCSLGRSTSYCGRSSKRGPAGFYSALPLQRVGPNARHAPLMDSDERTRGRCIYVHSAVRRDCTCLLGMPDWQDDQNIHTRRRGLFAVVVYIPRSGA